MEFGMEDGAARDSQRRRSPRFASPPFGCSSEMTAVKRSITVKKIVPRKTVAPSEHDKENTPSRRSEDARPKKPKVSTPDPVPNHVPPSSSVARKQQRRSAAMLSPILPSPPPSPSGFQQPVADPENATWSQKARRSYSRLSGRSLSSPAPRETLFGFETLKTPEVLRATEQSRTALEANHSGLGSFTSLLEAEETSEPDPNIPGVVVVKERRRRRRKVQHMDTMELDVLAARMNEEFQKAEEFELVVE